MKTGLSTEAKLGIELAITTAVVSVAVFAALLFLDRRRSNKLKDPSKHGKAISNEVQPYLQPKGELDAEEGDKHELQADEVRHQLPEDNEIRELPTTVSIEKYPIASGSN